MKIWEAPPPGPPKAREKSQPENGESSKGRVPQGRKSRRMAKPNKGEKEEEVLAQISLYE